MFSPYLFLWAIPHNNLSKVNNFASDLRILYMFSAFTLSLNIISHDVLKKSDCFANDLIIA